MSLKKWIYNFFSFCNYYYFPTSISRLPKKIYSEGFQVDFDARETAFLKQSAITFNYATDYSNGYWQKQLYVCELNQVTLLGNSGALIKQNKVIAESAFDQVRLCISPAYRSPALMWKKHKKGLYTAIFHLPWAKTSNYHWFFDCLPRLFILMQVVKEPIQLIVNQDIPAFQLETLRFVLKEQSNFTITFMGKYEKWELEQFIFPGFATNHSSGYLPLPVIHFLQRQIWQGYQVKPQDSKTRIYISRGKARKRRVLNENNLIAALTQKDFKIIYAEDLDYGQQVQLFYNAAFIIAPHGAGLTNILFSQQCNVVELHPADIIKPHYFLAAKALCFKYEYVIGSVADDNLDFTVDVKQVLAKYDLLTSQ